MPWNRTDWMSERASTTAHPDVAFKSVAFIA